MQGKVRRYNLGPKEKAGKSNLQQPPVHLQPLLTLCIIREYTLNAFPEVRTLVVSLSRLNSFFALG